MNSNEAVPAVRVSEREVHAAKLDEATLTDACKQVRIKGWLLLENVFSFEYVDRLRGAFLDRYGPGLANDQKGDALEVGDKRFMIVVDIENPFNEPDLFANPCAFSIVQKLLGDDCILGSFGAVAALPGALTQHTHRDMHLLFGSPLEAMMPCYALTMIIPLVELGEENGTTRIWSGSHVATTNKVDQLPHQDPVVSVGSCLLMDYRLIHAGTANRSANVRPILYVVYSKPWFRDYVNFRNQSPLRVSREDYEKMSAQHRALFATALVG